MRHAARPIAAVALALLVGACTAGPGSSAAAGTPSASPSRPAASSAAASPQPKPTTAASPVTASAAAQPAASVGTTVTAWGRILDAVPSTFPVYPKAAPADPPSSGAVSGAWTTAAAVNAVATWYRGALLAAHWAKVDDGGALEDGSHVLDVQGDLPECKAQVKVSPAGRSTLVTVLYGAGCAGGDG